MADATDTFTLEIERTLNAPLQSIWKCWTTPELLMQWFCPKPWNVIEAEIDLTAGGRCNFVMQGPNGETVPNTGIYLQVELNRRLVFTDAFQESWHPSGKPFMVGDINFSAAPENRTHYIARVHHWNAEDMEEHKKMGFEAGWNAATDQLEALARTIS